VGRCGALDAFDAKAVERPSKKAVAVKDRPSVVIVEGACTLIEEFTRKPVVSVDPGVCNGCALCFRVGCRPSSRARPPTSRPAPAGRD